MVSINMFKKTEITNMAISILVLGLVFGFDDGKETFVLTRWLLNLLGMILIVAIIILIRETVIKITANRHKVDSEYGLWNIKKVLFKGGNLKSGVPIGIILTLLFSILSKGKLFFTAIGSHNLKERLAARTGRKYIFLEYKEESLIVMSGILTNISLIYIAALLQTIFSIKLNNFITINFFIALFNIILPVSNLDGAKIFFGSRLQWVFGVLFLLTSFSLFRLGFLTGLIIAAVLSGIGVLVYYFKWN